jgi:molecular chaperone DnaK (HSP70)
VLRSALTCTAAESMTVHLVPRPVAALAGEPGEPGEPGTARLVVDIDHRSTELSLVTDGRVVETMTTDLLGVAWLDRMLAAHLIGQLAEPLGGARTAALVRDCAAARADLTRYTSTTVTVPLTSGPARLRVVRAEFEDLIRARVEGTVSAAVRMLTRAREHGLRVESTLLIGEPAATPLLWESMSARLPCPVVVPDTPAWTVTVGAATLAAGQATRDTRASDRTLPIAATKTPRAVPTADIPDPAPARPARTRDARTAERVGPSNTPAAAHAQHGGTARTRPGGPPSRRTGARVRNAVLAAAVAAGLIAGGGAAISGGGHGGGYHARG